MLACQILDISNLIIRILKTLTYEDMKTTPKWNPRQEEDARHVTQKFVPSMVYVRTKQNTF